MARKKKPSRKYTPRNEFRYNNSKRAAGHPHYVFGEKDDKYYSLGLTTHPKDKYPTYALSGSPNPISKKKDSVQRKPFVQNKKLYGKKQANWSFSKSDMAIIRHIIKDYKRKQKK